MKNHIENKYNVFISSTIRDLEKIRFSIRNSLELKYYINPILSEFPDTFPKSIKEINTFKISVECVHLSHIFVLLVNKIYGNIEPNTETSITESEFIEALNNKIHRIVFIEKDVVKNYFTFKSLINSKDKKEFLSNLSEKGYDNPIKLMHFISKISKYSLFKEKDNWYWEFEIDDIKLLLKNLEYQIDNYVKQLEIRNRMVEILRIIEPNDVLDDIFSKIKWNISNIGDILKELSDYLINFYEVGNINIKAFCGRRNELKQLFENIRNNKTTEISGIGGIGKTTLCEVALLFFNIATEKNYLSRTYRRIFIWLRLRIFYKKYQTNSCKKYIN